MLVLLLCIFLSPGCLSVDPPILTLPSGKVQGHYLTSRAGDPFLAYEGIPYGLPPVDTLRWLPAFPADPWEGVRNCSETPPMCIQSGYYTMWDPDVVFGQEDCLYLNVYTNLLLIISFLRVAFLLVRNGNTIRCTYGVRVASPWPCGAS